MKKMIALLLVLAVAMSGIAMAEMDICQIAPTGKDFGAHVAMHAQEGHFSGDMNPGVHHQGYSVCVP